MVENLLTLRKRLDAILSGAFSTSAEFVHSLKSGMEFAINSKANLPAAQMAKFIDSKLRMGTKGRAECEIETLLDRVMVLFRYIHGKDTFQAFYKKALAKRLLLGKDTISICIDR